jgi:APA family basic amino acid/polyamine antiporter
LTNQAAGPKLARALGLREGIAIQMGMIIGSGIFIVPATIAGRLHAMGPILAAWIAGGLLTLCGALTVAELSSILPEAGGPYVYLRHGFGRLWAFLFSWNHFFINTGASVAAIAVAFATYLGVFFSPLSPQATIFQWHYWAFGRMFSFSVGWVQVTAIGVLALVTYINVRGVKFSGSIMNVLTLAKVGTLIFLIGVVWFSPRGSLSNFNPWWPEHWSSEITAAFGLSMISVLWAYDGWITVTLTAGEMKEPQRNIPLSLLIGTSAVNVLYLLANLAYAYVIPIDTMAGSPRIAADVAGVTLGSVGAMLISAGILCSSFGTINGCILGGPRCLYAAGADGTFPKRFGAVHPRFRTPHVAVVTLGIWGAVLTLSGTYDQIVSYVVFGSWAFYALTALSVIVLRRKLPDAPRPYKAWGYPYVTLAFVGAAAWFVWNTLVRDTRNAVVGIALLLVSLPLYFLWTRKSVRELQ